MKILIITQKVDKRDSTLSFFNQWISEFSKYFEHVSVICLEKGEDNTFPHNVSVFSLGKEKKVSRISYLRKFYSLIWQERKNYDVVFVHMNPEYIVLGGLLWKVWGKRVSLWYNHRSVSKTLQIAEKITDVIFTASREGCCLKSDKIQVVGHGIATAEFHEKKNFSFHEPLRLLSVGRITRIKNLETLIEGFFLLLYEKKFSVLRLVGDSVTKDDGEYKEELFSLILNRKMNDEVIFAGGIPFQDVAKEYRDADISVNLAPTGGMDKAVLESFAARLPVFLSNTAFKTFLGEYSSYFLFEEKNPTDLAAKILLYLKKSEAERSQIQNALRSRVEADFGLSKLVYTMSTYIKSL